MINFRANDIMDLAVLCCILMTTFMTPANAYLIGSAYPSLSVQQKERLPPFQTSDLEPGGSERGHEVARRAAEPRVKSVADTSSTKNTISASKANVFNFSIPITNPPRYPLHCFNDYSTRLASATEEDCEVVINFVILAYPNPMEPKTFGYSDEVDVDLTTRRNQKWHHGNCVVFVRNLDKTKVDTFRMVDVAEVATRLTKVRSGEEAWLRRDLQCGSQGRFLCRRGRSRYPWSDRSRATMARNKILREEVGLSLWCVDRRQRQSQIANEASGTRPIWLRWSLQRKAHPKLHILASTGVGQDDSWWQE